MSTTYAVGVTLAWADETPFGLLNAQADADATVIAVNDLMERVDAGYNGEVKVVNNADKSEFVGISMKAKTASDTALPEKCQVATKGVALLDVASGSTTMYWGEMAKYSTGANNTAWSVEKNTAEGVFWLNQQTVAASGVGKFKFDSWSLRAVSGFSTWELPT